MSTLFDQVNSDIKSAMKNKEKEKLDALRYLKSLFMQNNTSTNPKNENDVLVSHVKKLKDSLSSYPEGSDQIVKIENELSILKSYMPEEMNEEDVLNLINEIKSNLDKPNMGLIMKELSGKIKGRFDGKRASEMVKESLK